MRLLKIWDSEYPWDVRAEKVMRSLSEAGHEIHLVARNRTALPEREERSEATVHRLRSWSALGPGLDGASQFPAFVNPRWIAHIHSVARRTGAQVVLVRDLPLAPTAVGVARALGIPVVLDMAENYPAMIRDIWTSGRQKPLDWIVRNPSLVSLLEKSVLRLLDHLIVVVEESKERVVELGVDPGKVSIVCNTPWPGRIPEDPPGDRASGGPVRLVYLGLLEKPRGLDAVLGGLARLGREGIATHLDVIGGGRDAELFRTSAASLGLGPDAVHFHGVLPYEDALRVVAAADIGVVPHLAVESWNTTIPNKLFDYMSMGLPVVTSDARPAARIVREEGCGLVFLSDDAPSFAEAVRELLDRATRHGMGNRGRKAVRERYNWSVDGRRLVAALESLVR